MSRFLPAAPATGQNPVGLRSCASSASVAVAVAVVVTAPSTHCRLRLAVQAVAAHLASSASMQPLNLGRQNPIP